MFLHLGADTVIPLKDVIAIADIKFGKSNINNDFIKNMYEEKMIIDISEGSPKSFIITDKYIFLSTISSLTLKKRSEQSEQDDY